MSYSSNVAFVTDISEKDVVERDSVVDPPYFCELNRQMQDSVIGCSSTQMFRVDGNDQRVISSVGYVHVLAGRTKISLRITALVTHVVHVMLLNVSVSYRR